MLGFVYYPNYADFDETTLKFLLYAGLRRQEFTRLRLSDIRNGYIFVRNGKGGKDRTIPLHRELGKLDIQTRYAPPLDYLVSYHGKPICDATLERSITRLRLASRVNRLHAHMLRHTFATMLYRNGTDIATLQELLGHSSINTTRIYISVSPAHLDGAIRGLGF